MAKLQNTPPAYWPPTQEAKGYFPQIGPYGPLISKHTRRHAPPRPFPSYPNQAPPWELTASANRRFHKWAAQTWKTVLTNANRLAWKNLAAVTTIRKYDGTLGILKAFGFFIWYHTTWRKLYYTPGRYFRDTTATAWTDPLLPWTPPTTPTNPHDITLGPQLDYLNFKFDSAPYVENTVATATMRRLFQAGGITRKRSFLWINADCASIPPHAGEYQASVDWYSVFPIPLPTGLYQLRFRILPIDATFTPSDWVDFEFTV